MLKKVILNLRLLFFLLVFLLSQKSFSQEIKITASDQSLNKILVDLRDGQHVDFSFNETELAKYKLSISKSFKTIDEALSFLLKDLPFQFENSSGVYIIFPKREITTSFVKIEPKVYRISGRISEIKTKEVLPYSYIKINSQTIVSDQNGNFFFSSETDSIFHIQVSHLGYVIKDTTLYLGRRNLSLELIPSNEILTEVIVKDNPIQNFSNSGDEVATIKLNHKVTQYMPGHSDNSVFNLLRLQSGVLASGEQTNNLIIWGSYQGQSRVFFDGFTVFGLKNFNDNISAINPLITKNVELRKAGYDANYGECVGGIVEISAFDGNTSKPELSLSVNNLTLSSLLEIPILQKSSLQLAYRQTYYNLYKDGYQLFPRELDVLSEIAIQPDYQFRDYNLKYSFKNEQELFYISLLRNADEFSYSLTDNRNYRDIVKNTSEINQQFGGAIFYENKLNDRVLISSRLTHSNLTTELLNELNVTSTITDKLVHYKLETSENGVQETRLELQSQIKGNEKNTYLISLQAINNSYSIKEDSFEVNFLNTKINEPYYTLEFSNLKSFNNLHLNFGLRTNLLPYLNEMYFEPRLSFAYSFSERIKWNAAWGMYDQFLVQSSVIDELGNYKYVWTLADNIDVSVLQSQHWVSGFSYTNSKFFLGLDLYFKTTSGLSRYINFKNRGYEDTFRGDGKSYGGDLNLKYNLLNHSFLVSYTLSKTLEHFSYIPTEDYLFAPQDQRHELKFAGLLNFSPFYFSLNYVYGSGLLNAPFNQIKDPSRTAYKRMDISATYKFSTKKINTEIGISILNLLNTKNKKASNLERIPLTQINTAQVYFETIPFTPTLFLILKF